MPAFHPCPCCGHRTLPERRLYDLCPVCFWEDDPHQTDDPRSSNGANGVSLVVAQQTYLACGAMHPALRVRQPTADQRRSPVWHPFGTAAQRSDDQSDPSA